MIETLMLGLMATEMNNATAKEKDMNRFGEIMNGSPLTSFEANAVKGMIGAIMSASAPTEQKNPSNPIMDILGGNNETISPLVGMLSGLLSK